MSHWRLVSCLLFAAVLHAQPPWPDAIQNQDLAGIARLISQPGAQPWPELSGTPSALALQVHAKIKQFEGAQPPDIAAIPARVRLYSDLARRFRAARGYANYVLADTLQSLSVLHLARLVTSDPARAAECAALLQSLDFPLLTPARFAEIYRAKLGAAAPIDSDTPQQMLATMRRLGDAGEGFPVNLDAVHAAGTGSLLTRTNPAGFIFRLSTTELLGRGALPELIEFLRKGGRLADINPADVRNYQKVIPGDYSQKTFGVVTAQVGVSQVHQLIADASDPNSNLLLCALDGPRRPGQNRFQVKEQVIGKAADFRGDLVMGTTAGSPRYYVIAKRGSQSVLLTEHGESRPYEDIRNVVLNLQGTRLAFVARRGEQELVVLDGVESQPYERIHHDELRFSPDGRHFAFLGQRTDQYFIVTDGRESAPLPDVIGLSFSPSQQLAYMVRRNRRWTIVYGQHVSPEYRGVNGPKGITFSPDGKFWVYQATTLQGERRIVLEGARNATFPARELHDKPIFSPDGRRILFRIHAAEPYTVDVQLLDLDRASPPLAIHASEVFFSRDLLRYATVNLVQRPNYRVTIDGREYPASGINIPPVTFSARGTRFTVGGDKPLIDGTPIPAGQFLFSPDEKSFARATIDRIVRDGIEVQAVPPGGTGHYAMAFSPDSRHLAYAVPHGFMHWSLAVDGEEAIPTYDSIPYNYQIVFDAPTRFRTIAVRGDDVLLVELSW